MIVKPDLKPIRGQRFGGPCDHGGVGKRQYRRRCDAVRALRQLQAAHGGHVDAYRCRECGWFHVGHPRRAA